jgi:hypothetical protein
MVASSSTKSFLLAVGFRYRSGLWVCGYAIKMGGMQLQKRIQISGCVEFR